MLGDMPVAKRATIDDETEKVSVKRPKGFIKNIKHILKWTPSPGVSTVCEDVCSFCQIKFVSESLYQCQVCSGTFCSVCSLNLYF